MLSTLVLMSAWMLASVVLALVLGPALHLADVADTAARRGPLRYVPVVRPPRPVSVTAARPARPPSRRRPGRRAERRGP